jgi:CubicO group peptidase (beta-lactamase class C family)
MTESQINYMTSAAPSDVQWATESDALALGFRVQVIPSLGGWSSLQLGAFGERMLDSGQAIATDTVFAIFSTTKAITGTAVMQCRRGR